MYQQPEVAKAIGCPINLLPTETLAEIMTFTTFMGYRVVSFEAKDAPLVFCHICSLWRAIAFSTPTLWKEFGITITPKSIRWKIHPLRLFLQNSSAQLLEISVEAQEFDESPRSVRALTPYVDVLAQHAKRWHWVKFFMPPKVTGMILSRAPLAPNLDNLMLSPEFSAPMLAGLPAACDRPRVDLSRFPNLTVLLACSSLFEFSVDGPSTTKLTRLNYVGGLQVAMDIVSRSPELDNLRIGIVGEDPPPRGIAHLPRVTQLSILLDADTPIFQKLDVPALLQFQYIEEGAALLPSINRMLSRCKPPLKKFVYMGGRYRGQLRDFLILFNNAPTLTELVIYSSMHQTMFEALVWSETFRELPLLECLTFYDVVGDHVCSSIHSFVSSRLFWSNPRLKWLALPKAVVDEMKRWPGTAQVLKTGFRYKETGMPFLGANWR